VFYEFFRIKYCGKSIIGSLYGIRGLPGTLILSDEAESYLEECLSIHSCSMLH